VWQQAELYLYFGAHLALRHRVLIASPAAEKTIDATCCIPSCPLWYRTDLSSRC
jgi:hypothetical protein